jgi:adenylate cyclase
LLQLGYEPREYLEHADFWLERVHPEDREGVRIADQEAMKTGGRFSYEFRVHTKDGEIRLHAAQGEVLMDEQGRPLRVLGTEIDNTAPRRAEEALRESEER